MINAELQYDEYLLASADEWLADVAEFAPDITAAFCDVDDEADGYATTEVVLARMEALGYSGFTGIYGEESNVVSVSMCNEDHYLDDDLSFVFLHCERDEWPHAFIIINGRGYWQSKISDCEVYEFTGDDDAEAFGYASASVGCDTCDSDLLVEHNTIFRNGGGGERWDIASIVRVDESELAYVPCPNPDCPSGRLHFMVG
jgi:hypothetical protein